MGERTELNMCFTGLAVAEIDLAAGESAAYRVQKSGANVRFLRT